MTWQKIWRSLFAMALALSVVCGTSMTASATAEPKRGNVATTQTQIDPRWHALIQRIDRASKDQSVQPAQAQVFAPTVHLNLSSGIISGRVDQSGAIAINVFRNGILVYSENFQPLFEGSGYTFVAGLSSRIFLRANDVMTLSQANQTNSASLTIPEFAAWMDPQADIVSGYITSHTTVHVQATSFATPTLSASQDVSVTADNTFTSSLGSLIDVRPRDLGFAWVDTSSNIHIYRSFSVPMFQVESGGNIVASPNGIEAISAGPAPGPNELTVLDAAGVKRAMVGLLTPTDRFAIPLTVTLNISDRVIIRSGNLVSAIVITIPQLSVQPDANGTHLIGDAPSNAPVELRVFNGPITDQDGSLFGSVQPISRVITTVDAQGRYTVPLTLIPASYVFAIYTTPSGHEVFARYTKPYIRVRIGTVNTYHGYGGSGYEVTGQFGPINDPLTITVQGPSGYPKIVRYTVSRNSGYFSDPPSPNSLYDDPVAVNTGDIVTVSAHSGGLQVVQIPEFQVLAERRGHFVFGVAPPNSVIKLLIPRNYLPMPLRADNTPQFNSPLTVVPPLSGYLWSTVIAVSASGTFSVTLPEFATYQESLSGEAELILANGNAIAQAFTDYASCRPYVTGILVGGNRIAIANGSCPTERFRAELWSSNGRLKWSQDNYYQPELTLIEPNTPGSMIIIEGGDQIRLTQGSYSETSTVPTFTLSTNRVQNSLSGTAPPNAVVNVYVYRGSQVPYIPYPPSSFGPHYITQTVADSEGNYHIALGSALSLTVGTLVEANTVDQERLLTTFDAIPLLNVFPSNYGLTGRLKPFTLYTFTLSNSEVVTNSFMRFADGAGHIEANFGRLILPNDQILLDSPIFSTTFVVPHLSSEVDFEKSLLVGSGPPNAQLAVWQWSSTELYYGTAITALGTLTVNAAGQFSFTLPSAVLAERANLKLSLRYDINENVRSWRDTYLNLAQWHIDLDAHNSYTVLPIVTSIITMTMHKANSPNVEIPVDVISSFSPTEIYARFEKPIEGNDMLTLRTVRGDYTFTVPLLNAIYSNPISYLPFVSGRTQPKSQITIIFDELADSLFTHPIRRSTTSDASGQWGIDLSDVRPKVNAKIRIIYRDEFGNEVERNLNAVLLTLTFPIVLRN